MASDLTPELRQAIEASSGPLELVDRQTNEHFVVIRAEVYERLKSVLDLSEPAEAERLALLQHMGRAAGWEDPSSDGLI